MTADLRDLLVHQADSALADAVAEAPDDLWSRGRSQRRRRRVTTGAATLAALAAVGGGVAGVTAYGHGAQPPATSVQQPDARALGYPERITGIDDREATAGPVSAIAWAPISPSAGGEPGRSGIYAVLSGGRMQRIAGIGDSPRGARVSPNGRFVAYTDGESYHLLDLTAGTQVGFERRLSQRPDLAAQIVWSADSRQVYLPLTGQPADGFAVPLSGVIVDSDGGSVAVPRGHVTVAGFAGGELVGIGYLPDRHNYAVQVLDADRLEDSWQDTGVTLESTGTRPGPEFVIGSASLSGNGTRLALRSLPTTPGNPTHVRIFDVASGGRIADVDSPQSDDSQLPEIPVQADDGCPLAWRGNRLLVPWKSDRTFATSTTRAGVAGDPVVVANPALDLICVDWADDALAGERHMAFFGVQDSWIAWHPGTVLAALGGVAALGAWLLARPWLRRRSAP